MEWLGIWIGTAMFFLVEPLSSLLGVLIGGFARRPWHLPLGALAAGAILRGDVLLARSMVGDAPLLGLQYLGSATAALIIAAAVYWLRSLVRSLVAPGARVDER